MLRWLCLCGCWLIFPVGTQAHAQKDVETKRLVQHVKTLSAMHPDAAYLRKAVRYFRSDEWDSTLLYSLKELSRKQSSQDVRNLCLYYRGVSFQKKQLFQAARRSFLRISERFPFPHLVQIHLGGIALETGAYPTAIAHFEQANQSVGEARSDYSQSALLQNIGLCYLHLERYNEAETHLMESTRLQELAGDTVGMVAAYMNLANLYYAQYKDGDAIPYFERAYHLSQQLSDFELKQNAALNMAVVEENRENPLKALGYRKEYESWHDSLSNQNKVWALAEAEKEYAVGEKQKQIQVLTVENKLKRAERNVSFVVVGGLVILLVIVFYFFRQQSKSKRIILAQKQHLDALNLMKDKLFSIISHDLRSSVSALKHNNEQLLNDWLEEDHAQRNLLFQNNSAITNSVYSLLDNLLNWSMLQTSQLYFHRETLHLSSVVEQVVSNYIPLLAHKKIVIECTVDRNLTVHADLDSIKIVLRNLLDNAIKFSDENDVLRIYSSSRTGDCCELIVEDQGAGMSAPTLAALRNSETTMPNGHRDNRSGAGLGLQLCREMIDKNKGSLDIESQEGHGTRILIQLPTSHKNQELCNT